MITHAPGPFERMIRRIADNIGDWCDRRAVRQVVKEHNLPSPPNPKAMVVHGSKSQAVAKAPEPAPECHEPGVAHPVSTGEVAAHRPVARKVAHSEPRELLTKIAKAIEDGRASGSQREIARAFNVSRATVQRAQRLVREVA